MHSGNTNIAVDVSTTTVAVLMHPHATLPVVEPTPQSGGNAKVEDIQPAGTCRINGAQRCTQAGITSEWLTCANFKWVARQCADGLVCHNAEQEGILCDYPKQKAKAQVKLDGFAGHHPLLAVEPIMGDNV
ncbi:hypothetical protein BC940DRAFT_38799 [Gongronella butleri]|nr:hypothetical protein BC940DRAFT_38799 [Gongronella butleri]